jgi:hypothetical protein
MFRAGMWVADAAGRVGICYLNARTSEREVHLVDENGETIAIIAWSKDWNQATHAQIPEPRRPSIEIALKYGYAVNEAAEN